MDNNIEALVITWLNDKYDWQAYGNWPSTSPMKLLLVDRTGGGRESMVLDTSEILIECFHKTSRPEASNMANTIGDDIRELLLNENITNVGVNSIVYLSDTIRSYHRYQVYVDVHHRR